MAMNGSPIFSPPIFALLFFLSDDSTKKNNAQIDGLLGPVRSVSTKQGKQQIEW
jgi:hypothetical protein